MNMSEDYKDNFLTECEVQSHLHESADRPSLFICCQPQLSQIFPDWNSYDRIIPTLQSVSDSVWIMPVYKTAGALWKKLRGAELVGSGEGPQ